MTWSEAVLMAAVTGAVFGAVAAVVFAAIDRRRWHRRADEISAVVQRMLADEDAA